MTLIAQITDLHIRPNGLACRRVSETNMLAERAVRVLNALDPQPDAIVITGDIADGGDEREYATARALLSRLRVPVYMMPGNHDLTGRMRAGLSGFPGIEGGTPGKMHYTADIGALRLIALDSSVPGGAHGELGEEQLAWLDRNLGETGRPTVVALHHPPAILGIRHMDAIALIDREAFTAVISKHPHVERVICGHVHRSIVTRFAGTVMALAPSTAHQVVLDLHEDAPPAFVMEPPAFFLHHFTKDSGLVTHLAYVESYPGPFPFIFDEGVA
ncbi:phosphodiesterase [Rhizobiales bacterium]|uniref:phosphodiesterase n=1 Tax=Hongsoonwoonella zoysiae TaxID=2821844 RepID=UPI001560947F|nr:phosphodiesterase [Hongsoonwoonella zoysiae]NRG19074.1 phosphodiesterase [Hongsoonwoonella zoysiae]